MCFYLYVYKGFLWPIGWKHRIPKIKTKSSILSDTIRKTRKLTVNFSKRELTGCLQYKRVSCFSLHNPFQLIRVLSTSSLTTLYE